MVVIETSAKSVHDVVEEIINCVGSFGFSVLHIHNVKNTLNLKGFDFDKECQILDVCSPRIAQAFLDKDMIISTIMPCKVSVYEEKGKTKIAMNSITQLVDDLNPELTDLAEEVQEALIDIIQRAK